MNTYLIALILLCPSFLIGMEYTVHSMIKHQNSIDRQTDEFRIVKDRFQSLQLRKTGWDIIRTGPFFLVAEIVGIKIREKDSSVKVQYSVHEGYHSDPNSPTLLPQTHQQLLKQFPLRQQLFLNSQAYLYLY